MTYTLSTNDILRHIIDKRFRVVIAGEVERHTNFFGLIKLLAAYSDFFEYSTLEQKKYLTNAVATNEFNIDANIYCTLI